MSYIQTYELKDFTEYCKTRCKKIVTEHNKTNLKYSRGLYKGYIYGVKLSYFLQEQNLNVNERELYIHLKNHKNSVMYTTAKDTEEYIRGMTDSLYDIMNYVSCIKSR